MKLPATLFALGVAASLLGAQEQPTKPYREGDVHAFLDQARLSKRPAVVLFNFDLESG